MSGSFFFVTMFQENPDFGKRTMFVKNAGTIVFELSMSVMFVEKSNKMTFELRRCGMFVKHTQIQFKVGPNIKFSQTKSGRSLLTTTMPVISKYFQ